MSYSQIYSSANGDVMGTAPNTHAAMEGEETGECLEGQTLGLVTVLYFEEIGHVRGVMVGGKQGSNQAPMVL